MQFQRESHIHSSSLVDPISSWCDVARSLPISDINSQMSSVQTNFSTAYSVDLLGPIQNW